MRVYRGVLFLLIILHQLCVSTVAVRWLALAMTGTSQIGHEENCDTLSGLAERQKRICRRNVEVMAAVKSGAHMAIEECQHQFKDRRWNCSMVDSKSLFGSLVYQGTKETAFVHGIAAAGVSHAVTRACSTGGLDRCGCDRTVRGKSAQGFEWAGCSDNVAYGNAFSKMFVDAREKLKGKDASRAMMNLHNNEAGRKAIENHMRIVCKCHGVSGSCELKTCWWSLPSFREVGDVLRQRFDAATPVTSVESGKRISLRPVTPAPAAPSDTKTASASVGHRDEDLVYLQSSPDFCEYDPRRGSLGTEGRRCNKTSDELDGCDVMCCGRNYVTVRRKVEERCRCKFHWCCQVRCQTCIYEHDEHYCR